VVDLIRREDHQAVFSIEGSHPNDNMEKFNTGIEYWYKNMFSLRVGDYISYDAGGFSAGAGARLNVSKIKLNFDYGYHDMGLLNSIHRFSVGVIF
jgi:hypothetical protein